MKFVDVKLHASFSLSLLPSTRFSSLSSLSKPLSCLYSVAKAPNRWVPVSNRDPILGGKEFVSQRMKVLSPVKTNLELFQTHTRLK